MKKNIATISELKAVIEYIIWSHNENLDSIEDKQPNVFIKDLGNVYEVKILFIGEIKRGDSEQDPTISIDDEPVFTNTEFSVLKDESFRNITKYVEDACREIANVKID